MSSMHTVTTVKLERKGFIGLTLPDHGASLEEVRTGAKVRTSPQQPRQDKTASVMTQRVNSCWASLKARVEFLDPKF